MIFRSKRTRLDPCLCSQHQAQSLAQRRRLQLKRATYLAQAGAQRQWERGGVGLDGEGEEIGAGAKAHTRPPGVGVGLGTGF